MLLVELRRTQRIRVGRRGAREESLRKVGAITGPRRVRAQQGDTAGIAFAPERFGSSVPRSAAAQDHHGFRSAGRHRKATLFCRCELFANIHAAVSLLDAPAGDRVQRRRSQGLAGAQAEARMMPGAAHRIVNQQSVGERRTVMRADRTNGEYLIPAPREQHGLTVRMSGEHGPVGDLRERDAIGEVGSVELALRWAHAIVLEPAMGGARTLWHIPIRVLRRRRHTHAPFGRRASLIQREALRRQSTAPRERSGPQARWRRRPRAARY